MRFCERLFRQLNAFNFSRLLSKTGGSLSPQSFEMNGRGGSLPSDDVAHD